MLMFIVLSLQNVLQINSCGLVVRDLNSQFECEGFKSSQLQPTTILKVVNMESNLKWDFLNFS
jgi:hypothetical protein